MKRDKQYISENELLDMQNRLIGLTARYMYMHSKYYHNLLNELNIDVNSINTIGDLQRLPILTKRDVLKHNNTVIGVNMCEASDLVSTSGSTGPIPIINPLTICDINRLSYNEGSSFSIASLCSNDYVMITATLDGSFVAGLAYYLGVQRIGASVVRTGIKDRNLVLEVLNNEPITAIVGVPSALVQLHDYCKEVNLEWNVEKIEKLILIGETIREKDFSLNMLGSRLSKCFCNAKLYSTYANTETCTSFCECDFGIGGHLLPDLAYAEILDENNMPLQANEPGRLVISTFGTQGMPLLRYDTGDITFFDDKKCMCGRTSMRLGPILSRGNNIIKIKGVTLSQQQLENAVLSVKQVKDYCIIVSNKEGIEYIKIMYLLHANINDFDENILRDTIWNLVRVNSILIKCNYAELKRVQKSGTSRKTTRLIFEK